MPNKEIDMKLSHWLMFLCCLLGTSITVSAASCPTIQICFSPRHNCGNKIIETIASAKQTILVQAYSFSSRKIAKALIAASKRGVQIKIILDRAYFTQDKLQKAIWYMYSNHIPLWIDYANSLSHNKIMIIDGQKVITGSYNFTNAADIANAENVLIINSADIASTYTANWQVCKELAKQVPVYNKQHPHELEQFRQQAKASYRKMQFEKNQVIQHKLKNKARQ
jgi:phosphatidylserine/phosphatidylglycerophosphate/cardiolipin synthase-like enzyme